MFLEVCVKERKRKEKREREMFLLGKVFLTFSDYFPL